MKRIVILVLAAMMAGLCACSAQTVWETVGGGCVRESDGASSVICVRLPQDAVEEVFAERGARQIYTQPGGGYEITTEILDAAPDAAEGRAPVRAPARRAVVDSGHHIHQQGRK